MGGTKKHPVGSKGPMPEPVKPKVTCMPMEDGDGGGDEDAEGAAAREFDRLCREQPVGGPGRPEGMEDEDLTEDGQGGAEAREVRGLRAPREPSKQEVEDHRRRGCLPPRNWCRRCVAARGIASPHKSRQTDRWTPVVSLIPERNQRTTSSGVCEPSTDTTQARRRKRRRHRRGRCLP